MTFLNIETSLGGYCLAPTRSVVVRCGEQSDFHRRYPGPIRPVPFAGSNSSRSCEISGTLRFPQRSATKRRFAMDGIIYLVGLVVIVMFILSFLGLR
jgi:hypothetical protein